LFRPLISMAATAAEDIPRVRGDPAGPRESRYGGDRSMKGLLVVLGVVLLALGVVSGAAADSRGASDPRNDTKGSHWPGPGYTWSRDGCWVTAASPTCGEGDYFEDEGPLFDIASIRHGHRGAQIVHRVTMVRNWGNALLAAGRRGQISLYFNLDRDAVFERRLDLYLRRGKPAAIMRAGSRSVGSAVVTRPNRKAVEVRFPRGLLGRRALTYRWFAFSGIGCSRKYDRCGDRSPGASLLSHRVR
jgi:hypothetical protein